MTKCSLCDNKLPDESATVIIEEYEMKICEECELLLNTMSKRLEQEKDGRSVQVLTEHKSKE